jgi:hypothetical protein
MSEDLKGASAKLGIIPAVNAGFGPDTDVLRGTSREQLLALRGEKINPGWTYKFYDTTPIEKDSITAPGKIDSTEGREFAALI